jgi:hypothetical protein
VAHTDARSSSSSCFSPWHCEKMGLIDGASGLCCKDPRSSGSAHGNGINPSAWDDWSRGGSMRRQIMGSRARVCRKKHVVGGAIIGRDDARCGRSKAFRVCKSKPGTVAPYGGGGIDLMVGGGLAGCGFGEVQLRWKQRRFWSCQMMASYLGG